MGKDAKDVPIAVVCTPERDLLFLLDFEAGRGVAVGVASRPPTLEPPVFRGMKFGILFREPGCS